MKMCLLNCYTGPSLAVPLKKGRVTRPFWSSRLNETTCQDSITHLGPSVGLDDSLWMDLILARIP